MQLHRRFSNFQFPIRPTVLWLLLSLNLTLTARAQEAPPILSLEQAIALALKQHATLIAAAQDTRAAQAGLRQARSALFPQLTLQSSYSRFESARSGFTIGNPGATENRETSLNVSQLIWDSGLTQASIRRAVAAARASRWGEEEARQNVAAQVARAYYGALRAQALVRLNKAVVQRAEKEVELAQTAFEIGTGARLDILRAQVQVSNTQVDLIAARNQVETALAELKNTMGVPRTQTFQVVETAPLPDMDQPLEDLIARAWKQRPETHRFAATRETQAQSLRTARIQCQPQLSIHANYEDFLYSTRDVTREWFIGAQFSAPLFDGGRTRAAVTQAQAELVGVQAQEENLRRNIALEVEQAYLALADARERCQAAEQSVRLATENLTAREESYKEDVASMLEITDAQVELTRAETNLIQAQYDWALAVIGLRQAVGDPVVP